MTLTREQIETEFDQFIEYPTDDKRYVSTVSAKLFAEHIAQIAFNAGRERGLVEAAAQCEMRAQSHQTNPLAKNDAAAKEALMCSVWIDELREST